MALKYKSKQIFNLLKTLPSKRFGFTKIMSEIKKMVCKYCIKSEKHDKYRGVL